MPNYRYQYYYFIIIYVVLHEYIMATSMYTYRDNIIAKIKSLSTHIHHVDGNRDDQRGGLDLL